MTSQEKQIEKFELLKAQADKEPHKFGGAVNVEKLKKSIDEKIKSLKSEKPVTK